MGYYSDSNGRTLKSVLNEIVKAYGWEDKIAETKMPDLWKEVVGDKVAEVSKVQKFDEGKLFVIVKSSTWRFELLRRSDSIIEKLNKKIGKDTVCELIVNIQ